MIQNLAQLLQAFSFAAERHRGQRRKDAAGTPYINHPLAVASLLAPDVGVTDLNLLAAAVLRDTVEDTATSLDEISGCLAMRSVTWWTR